MPNSKKSVRDENLDRRIENNRAEADRLDSQLDRRERFRSISEEATRGNNDKGQTRRRK